MDEPETFYVSAVRRRRQRRKPPRLDGPDSVYELMKPLMRDLDREHFYSVLVTTKHHVLSVELVSVGSLSANLVHPREVFKPAIVQSAGALVLSHNHPSGDPEPSNEDVEFTRRILRAGEILGITLLDHVVIGNGDYVSLKSRGVL